MQDSHPKIREALVVINQPIGNMVERHERIMRTLKADEVWRSGVNVQTVQALLDERDALEHRAEMAEMAHVNAAEERDFLREQAKKPSPAVTDASTQSTYPADVSKTSEEIDTTEDRAILDVYDKLHADKLGMHWLWSVVQQVAAGGDADAALREFGYTRGTPKEHEILHEVALALKGSEGELQRHSWHDLAELARKLKAATP